MNRQYIQYKEHRLNLGSYKTRHIRCEYIAPIIQSRIIERLYTITHIMPMYSITKVVQLSNNTYRYILRKKDGDTNSGTWYTIIVTLQSYNPQNTIVDVFAMYDRKYALFFGIKEDKMSDFTQYNQHNVDEVMNFLIGTSNAYQNPIEQWSQQNYN